MDFRIAGHQADGYTINTEVYTGPLDLLLQLIEKAELDITRLALAQVTDQYLEYLRHLEIRDPAEVSAFLVIAAKLVQIKSSALLPRPVLPELLTEEDPAEELARQLIIYKKFKELSKFLEYRETIGMHTYLRMDTSQGIQVNSKLDISELSLQDLVQAAREIFLQNGNLPPLSQVISQPRVTIRQKISSILELLKREGQTRFSDILPENRNRVDIVVAFLAMLELIKRHMVNVTQSDLFGEIELEAQGELLALDDQELEFSD
jgi:segregation and condensation protein A